MATSPAQRLHNYEMERRMLVVHELRVIKERDEILKNLRARLDDLDNAIVQLGGQARAPMPEGDVKLSDIIPSVAPFPPVKKKRGRKKLSEKLPQPPPPTPSPPQNLAQPPQPPPRRRGRPPKHKPTLLPSSDSAAVPAAPKPSLLADKPKRKRGRPPKRDKLLAARLDDKTSNSAAAETPEPGAKKQKLDHPLQPRPEPSLSSSSHLPPLPVLDRAKMPQNNISAGSLAFQGPGSSRLIDVYKSTHSNSLASRLPHEQCDTEDDEPSEDDQIRSETQKVVDRMIFAITHTSILDKINEESKLSLSFRKHRKRNNNNNNNSNINNNNASFDRSIHTDPPIEPTRRDLSPNPQTVMDQIQNVVTV